MHTRIVASWSNLLIMSLYLPFGLSLLLVRFFMCLHVFLLSSLLRRYEVTRYILRFMTGVLGGIVVSRSEEKSSQHEPAPIVSNHVTAFDHLAINVCVPCFSPDSLFAWSCSHKSVNLRQPSASDRKLLNNQEEPAHILPERLPGGNHRTVYQFDHSLFVGLDRVQPVAIEVRRLLPINLVCYPLSPCSELLWVLFNAFSLFHVTFLSPMRRREGESSEEFCERVRGAVVAALQATASPDTVEVARDRIRRAPPASATRARDAAKGAVPGASRKLDRLVQQVREVLPDTPARVIETELERTGDVDATIANILEGRAAAPSTSRSPAAAVSPSNFKTAAGRWCHSADERHMSFADRKEAFLENARRRYLEKLTADETN